MFDSEDFENLPEEIKKFILSMMNPKEGPKKINYAKLGKPTKVEKFMEDGIEFTKKTWTRKDGTVITQISQNEDEYVEFEDLSGFSKESFERQLEIALENENYEEAAKIRDKINGVELDDIIKPKTNRAKKKTKSKKSDNNIWDI